MPIQIIAISLKVKPHPPPNTTGTSVQMALNHIREPHSSRIRDPFVGTLYVDSASRDEGNSSGESFMMKINHTTTAEAVEQQLGAYWNVCSTARICYLDPDSDDPLVCWVGDVIAEMKAGVAVPGHAEKHDLPHPKSRLLYAFIGYHGNATEQQARLSATVQASYARSGT